MQSIFHFNIVTPTFYGTFFSCPGKRYLISKKKLQNWTKCPTLSFKLFLSPSFFSFFLLFTFSKKSLLDGASKKYLMWKSLHGENRMILERSEQSEVKGEGAKFIWFWLDVVFILDVKRGLWHGTEVESALTTQPSRVQLLHQTASKIQISMTTGPSRDALLINIRWKNHWW